MRPAALSPARLRTLSRYRSGPAAGALAVALALGLGLVACGDGGDGAEPGTLPFGANTLPGVTAMTQLQSRPLAIAAGTDQLWVLVRGKGAVSLDPRTLEPLSAPTRLPGGPARLAVGEQHAWVAVPGALLRLSPALGELERIPLDGLRPAGIAAGSGRVWISDRSGEVLAVDEDSGAVEHRIELEDELGELALAGDSAWIASASSGTLYRIDADSGRPHASIAAARNELLAVSAGEDAVWVIARDALRGGDLGIRSIELDGTPRGDTRVATGEHLDLGAGLGAVWVIVEPRAQQGLPSGSPSSSRPGIAVIDPSSLAQIGSIDAGGTPSALAVGSEAVWVASARQRLVSRIDP